MLQQRVTVIGAGLAGGCNLGHSLVGVPLLSMGSIVTTVSMFAGVWLADLDVIDRKMVKSSA